MNKAKPSNQREGNRNTRSNSESNKLPTSIHTDLRSHVTKDQLLHEDQTQMHEERRMEKEVIMMFIFEHYESVKAETMQGVIYNIERDISSALNQIHCRSLTQSSNVYEGKIDSHHQPTSYVEVAKKATKGNQTSHSLSTRNNQGSQRLSPRIPSSSTKSETDKIFITNLEENFSVVEIWRCYKRFGVIKDIFFPRKKDRFGKRFDS